MAFLTNGVQTNWVMIGEYCNRGFIGISLKTDKKKTKKQQQSISLTKIPNPVML